MRFELYPHLFFAQYGGTQVKFIKGAETGEQEHEIASAEITKVVSEDTFTTVTARLNAPDYLALPAFTDALSRSDAAPATAQEKRLAQNLNTVRQLPRPPLKETWHRFRLVREAGLWRVTYPLWRAEAMLAQAKVLAAEGQLEEALNLFDNVGRYAAKLSSEGRTSVICSASRGRRVLSQLARVELLDFTLASSPTCLKRASLTLHNLGNDLRSATVIVDFEVGEETSRQSFVLGKARGAISEGEVAYFELCLEPPLGWQGQASVKIGWLEFTEKVYKSSVQYQDFQLQG